MNGFITIDTLYLHIKYPNRNVFDFWHEPVKYIDTRALKNGYVVDDLVVKSGSSGYKISVWKHDARIYLTDQVDQKCGDGNGMGAWLQLGPKFIIENITNLHEAVNKFLLEVGIYGKYPKTINRIDIAVDLLDVSIKNQNIKDWSENWVGRSKLSRIFYNSRTGELETLYIGSRKSPVVLRVYDKVAQSKNDGDYKYWQDVWKGFTGDVTRVEWEIKPKIGNFPNNVTDFSLFNGQSMREMLNYLLDWGRLCLPNPTDSNRRRWEDSKFWAHLRSLCETWCGDIYWPTSRLGKEFHGVTDAYIKQVSGIMSGAMAHLDPLYPTLSNMFTKLSEYGEPIEVIAQKARSKAEVIKRL